MIKLQRRNDNPTPATADGGNDDLGGDQLQELFDAINSMGDDLRKEMNDKFVTKPTFQDLKNNTNDEFSGVKKRLDDLEKEQKRIAERTAQNHQAHTKEIEDLKSKLSKMLRDIRDLFAVANHGAPVPRSTAATSSEDVEDLKQMIYDLQSEVEKKQSIDDANK